MKKQTLRPQNEIDNFGPRDIVHCWATDVDDPTVMPRWGKVGKQLRQNETASPSLSGTTPRGCTHTRSSRRSIRR
jgi:hypothetical protein